MCKLSNIIWILFGVLSAVNNSSQRSTVESPDYVAAVVEFSPHQALDAAEVFHTNVNKYVELIVNATNGELVADIIVFAESGLAGLGHLYPTEIPLPSDKIVPCTDNASRYENLRKLSCAARDHEIYVVVNLSETYPCPDGSLSDYGETCPKTGVLLYNSNVAFDRSGAVVARYRKFHLFGEYPILPPPVADLVTFETDFGVTFGMFTCFDLMFDEPAIRLVKESGITDIIFPTAWFSELPFLSAVQAQAAWSYTMDVNFLASGYNQPAGGSAGSGIYAGRKGPLQYVMPSRASTHLLINRIVKKKNSSAVDQVPSKGQQSSRSTHYDDNKGTNEIYMKVDDLSAYESYLLSRDTPREVRLCHGEFCCDFEIVGNMSSDHAYGEHYFNRLLAFDGVRTFTGVATGGVQICAVVSCTDAHHSSCGYSFNKTYNVLPTGFEFIRIKGSFNRAFAAQFPNTLIDDYSIVPNEDFTFNQVVSNAVVYCDMILDKSNNLLTFAIFGREFTRDGEEVTLPTIPVLPQV